ncbi:MAG: sugar ABC transporter ATP-binding protein [Clostridia bacterium]|nr:sugar ABC transporter ATP-binding protein [Clostridia bacterium]
MAFVEIRNVHKEFGGVRALRGVDLAVEPGEVHVLLGENGAGKSTLIKILSGVYPPDAGEIRIEGEPVRLATPAEAQRRGIRTIHQELSLIPALTIGENLAVSRLPHGPFGLLRRGEIREVARRALTQLGVELDVERPVELLSLAEQQLVEIAKAISREARLLIMDEPTAALTAWESRRLFDVIRRLTGQGTSILYVSHRIEEISEIGHRVTVIRDGTVVGRHRVSEIGPAALIQEMVGHEVEERRSEARAAGRAAEALLEVRDLRCGALGPVSFEVRRGEIVGVAGVLGSGTVELARSLFGVAPLQGGRLSVAGRQVRIGSPREAVQLGVAYVPENRRHEGLIMGHSLVQNLTLAGIGHFARFGFLRSGSERERARELIEALRIVPDRLEAPVEVLSGGNQQKVAIGKWLSTASEILILHEPTRGVDVGARAEIYRLLRELADRGYAILIISSDFREAAWVCDRILVLRDGRLVGEIPGAEADAGLLLEVATGAREVVPA